jgi:hypothetical protein
MHHRVISIIRLLLVTTRRVLAGLSSTYFCFVLFFARNGHERITVGGEPHLATGNEPSESERTRPLLVVSDFCSPATDPVRALILSPTFSAATLPRPFDSTFVKALRLSMVHDIDLESQQHVLSQASGGSYPLPH